MESKKNYLWIVIIVVVLCILPLLINLCYLYETNYYVLHEPSSWATFWATYIAAIASFTMVFMTRQTLKQNRQQLEELKRQWDEEHTPYLSCQLIKADGYFKLRIFNSTDVTAKNVRISITNYTDGNEIFQFSELKEFLTNQLFIIPPKESLYFKIWITPYSEVENLPAGYIEVKLNTPTIDFGTYKLYPQNFAFVTYEYRERPIVDALSKVADKIKDQKVILK